MLGIWVRWLKSIAMTTVQRGMSLEEHHVRRSWYHWHQGRERLKLNRALSAAYERERILLRCLYVNNTEPWIHHSQAFICHGNSATLWDWGLVTDWFQDGVCVTSASITPVLFEHCVTALPRCYLGSDCAPGDKNQQMFSDDYLLLKMILVPLCCAVTMVKAWYFDTYHNHHICVPWNWQKIQYMVRYGCFSAFTAFRDDWRQS